MAKDNLNKKLPKSMRKFLRKEKARMRREFSDAAEAEAKIRELVRKIAEQYNKTKGLKK